MIFTFFYITIIFNTDEVADNLRKHGGFIAGIRPGAPTAEYLNTYPDAADDGRCHLSCVSSRSCRRSCSADFRLRGCRSSAIGSTTSSRRRPGLNWIPTGLGYQFFFGGTSLLILVGVAMDTVSQIEAQLVMRNYEGFLGAGSRLRGRRELSDY